MVTRGAGRFPSVADLLKVLEGTGLLLASNPASLELAVSRTTLLDPNQPLVETRGGILLGLGLSAASPASEAEAQARVHEAGRMRFGAVVVKSYGASTEGLAAVADAEGVALLVVDDDVEWLQLDSLLNKALTTATQVEVSLSSLAVADLFGLANAIADAVGGATAIEDFQQRVLAYSSIPAQPIDDNRRDGILGRQVPDLPENAEQYRALYRSEGVVHFPAEPPALPRIAVAVRAGAEPLGSIWVVDPDESLGDDAERALAGAATIAALHLIRARTATDLARQQRADLLRHLLDEGADAAHAVARLGLEPGGPFAVLGFEPAATMHEGLEPLYARLLDLVTLHCETRVGHTGSASIGGTIYVLLAGQRLHTDGSLRKLAGEVIASARSSLRLPLRGGVGPLVSAGEEIVRSRREADRVLSLLRHRPDLGPVGTSESLRNQLILMSLGERVRKDSALDSAQARQILEYDEQHGSGYAEALLTFFARLRDVNAAAKELTVHPNTLRYRLRRAVELFEIDLADPDQTLVIWLALRARANR